MNAKCKGALLSILLIVSVMQPLLSVNLASADLVSTAPGEKIFPTDDTYVMQTDTTPNGTYTSMYVGRYNNNPERGYMKFNLSSLVGQTVESATLYLYQWKTTGTVYANVQVEAVDDDAAVEEETLVWDSQPAIGRKIAGPIVVNPVGWYSWDITSYVNEELAGNGIVSIALVDTGENTSPDHSVGFDAKEWGGTDYDPYLYVEVPGYRVDLEIPTEFKLGVPGETLFWNVDVSNIGSLDDTYDLTVSDTQGWNARLEDSAGNSITEVSVPSGKTVTVRYLKVDIPADAMPGTEDVITVTATSQGDSNVSDSDTTTARAYTFKITPPAEDTYVDEANPTTPYGSSMNLYIESYTGQNKRTLLKFGLSAIPEGATIVGAWLWLYCWSASYADLNIQAWSITDDSWDEDTVTWETQPDFAALLDTHAMDLDTATPKFHSWNVTSFVQEEFAGDKTMSLGLKAETESVSGRYIFDSKEWYYSDDWPFLEVGYTYESKWIDESESPFTDEYAVAVEGAGNDIYFANSATWGDSHFMRYSVPSRTWEGMSIPPEDFKNGTALAWDNGNYIYALLGGTEGSDEDRRFFYRYNIDRTVDTDAWERLTDTPHLQSSGDALEWVPGWAAGDSSDSFIFAILGKGLHNPSGGSIFAKYSIKNNTWTTITSFPWDDTDDGASLVWAGGNYLYLLRGEEDESTPNTEFKSYNMVTDAWSPLAPILQTGGVGDGGALVWTSGDYSDKIFALPGGEADEDLSTAFFSYDIPSDTWTVSDSLPVGIGTQNGARLAYAAGSLFAWRAVSGDNSVWRLPLYDYWVAADLSPRYLDDKGRRVVTSVLRVRNTGKLDDTYDLTPSSTLGWPLKLTRTSMAVPADTYESALLDVTIPSIGFDSGTIDLVTVTPASTTAPSGGACAARAKVKKISSVLDEADEEVTDDARIYQRYPNNNYGSSPTLWVQSFIYEGSPSNARSYLKFDLSGLPGNVSEIIEAKLWIYCWEAKYDELNVGAYGVTDDTWTEETITWNNQPLESTWVGPLDVIHLPGKLATDHWYTWDVSSFVQTQYPSDNLVSLLVKGEPEDESGSYWFEAKEAYYDNPKLVIVYKKEVDVSVDYESQSDWPGTALKFNVEIKNNTSTTAYFNLSVSDTSGWPEIALSRYEIKVRKNSSETVKLYVTIPENERPPHEGSLGDNITVKAENALLGISDYEVVHAYATGQKPSDDALVDQGYPESNYGYRQNLEIQSFSSGGTPLNVRSFLKFDLSTLAKSAESITSAKLWIYAYDIEFVSELSVQAYGADDSWEEETVTWDTQPSSITEIGPNVISAPGWYSWDVTSFLQSQYGGGNDNVVTIGLKATTEDLSGLVSIDSKEYWNAIAHPYLFIETKPTILSLKATPPKIGIREGGVTTTTISYKLRDRWVDSADDNWYAEGPLTVKIWVVDLAGNTVRTIGTFKENCSFAGILHEHEWDGTDDSGEAVIDGGYSVKVKATDEDKNSTTKPKPVVVNNSKMDIDDLLWDPPTDTLYFDLSEWAKDVKIQYRKVGVTKWSTKTTLKKVPPGEGSYYWPDHPWKESDIGTYEVKLTAVGYGTGDKDYAQITVP